MRGERFHRIYHTNHWNTKNDGWKNNESHHMPKEGGNFNCAIFVQTLSPLTLPFPSTIKKKKKSSKNKEFLLTLCTAIQQSHLSSNDNCITLSQTTNFLLFQTERVCRQQFWITCKWRKILQVGRKHCGKRRNCSLWAISFFPPQCFQKTYDSDT